MKTQQLQGSASVLQHFGSSMDGHWQLLTKKSIEPILPWTSRPDVWTSERQWLGLSVELFFESLDCRRSQSREVFARWRSTSNTMLNLPMEDWYGNLWPEVQLLFNGRKIKDLKCFKMLLWGANQNNTQYWKRRKKKKNKLSIIASQSAGLLNQRFMRNYPDQCVLSLFRSLFDLVASAQLNSFGNHDVITQKSKKPRDVKPKKAPLEIKSLSFWSVRFFFVQKYVWPACSSFAELFQRLRYPPTEIEGTTPDVYHKKKRKSKENQKNSDHKSIWNEPSR